MARILSNWLKAYLEFTNETESPDVYHLWSAITVLGAASKRQVWLNLSYFKIFPNQYVILVGPSGAKKSSALDVASDIVHSAGIKKFSDKLTGAALIKDLSEASEKRVSTDGVIEVVSPILIYSSELGVFMGPDAYGSGVISDLTDLYDCGGRAGKWEKKTVGRGAETVLGPFVSLLAASTPQTLKDTIPPQSVGQGFTSRIIFVWAAGRRKRVPIPRWSATQDDLRERLIHDLKEISSLQGEFKFDPDGLQLYTSHYNSRPEPEEEYEDERLRGYSSRKDIHALKVAMALSLANGDSLTIGRREMDGAIEALNYLDGGLPNVFSGHGNSATAEDISRIFREIDVATKKEGYISHAALVRRNYHNLNSNEIDIVLKTLLEGGMILEKFKQKSRAPQGNMERCFSSVEGQALNSNQAIFKLGKVVK